MDNLHFFLDKNIQNAFICPQPKYCYHSRGYSKKFATFQIAQHQHNIYLIGQRSVFYSIYSIHLQCYFENFLLDGAIGAKPSSQLKITGSFKTFVTHSALYFNETILWAPLDTMSIFQSYIFLRADCCRCVRRKDFEYPHEFETPCA